ncbi:MAG: sialate O-acetylesterase, partial [Pedobacter sp.]
ESSYAGPIGIINASYGGTPIEAWMSEDGLQSFPTALNTVTKNKDTAYLNKLNARPGGFGNRTLKDAGLTAVKKWYDPAYQPVNWRSINIPGYWEDQGVKDLNGVVWYRKEIEVPESMTGKPATVFLGRIVDADELYINGESVGSTGYQYPQRRYKIPSTLLKPGKNLLTVRVTNTSGKGGFVPDKPYQLFAGSDTIDLKGTWQYKVGEVYIPSGNRMGGGGGGIAYQNQPTALYNAMVAPLVNYAIRGVCWYQGESNSGNPTEYARLLPALISDWRAKWRIPSMPFLFVQLPNFMDYNYTPAESNWAAMREAALNTLTVPNTAMAVTIDLGEWNDIHPDNKKDVGIRLALGALKQAYSKDIVFAGPYFQSASIEGN